MCLKNNNKSAIPGESYLLAFPFISMAAAWLAQDLEYLVK